MKSVLVGFFNLGGYHLARLQALKLVCDERNLKLVVLEYAKKDVYRPWGVSQSELEVHSMFETESSVGRRQRQELIKEKLDGLSPSVVLVPGWSHLLARAMFSWARARKVPMILMSESKRDDKSRYLFLELFKRWVFIRHFSSALVGGRRHKEYLVSLGMPASDISTGYDIVDNDFFKDNGHHENDNFWQENELPVVPVSGYFISATRLIARKNMSRLLSAYINYVNVVSNPVPLVIVGDGPEKAALQKIVGKYELHKYVTFLHFVPYQQMPWLYAGAVALLHPAISEQWGLVINEACASGLPVIVSKSVGAVDSLVLDGENGYLFDPYSEEEILQCLLRFHELSNDDRAAMADVGRELVSKCGPEQFAEGFRRALDVIPSY